MVPIKEHIHQFLVGVFLDTLMLPEKTIGNCCFDSGQFVGSVVKIRHYIGEVCNECNFPDNFGGS